jgi:hypothetical protein
MQERGRRGLLATTKKKDIIAESAEVAETNIDRTLFSSAFSALLTVSFFACCEDYPRAEGAKTADKERYRLAFLCDLCGLCVDIFFFWVAGEARAKTSARNLLVRPAKAASLAGGGGRIGTFSQGGDGCNCRYKLNLRQWHVACI